MLSGHSSCVIVETQPSSFQNDGVIQANGNMSDSIQDAFNYSNKIISPISLESVESGIDWTLVGKGIALSMGQGIHNYLLIT